MAGLVLPGTTKVLLDDVIGKGRRDLLLPIVLAIYTPMIYYTDLFMYRRAQRKKSAR